MVIALAYSILNSAIFGQRYWFDVIKTSRGWYDFQSGFDCYHDAERAMSEFQSAKNYRIELYSKPA